MFTMMTEEQFLSLKPRQRGYVVYMLGSRDDQPHVPDEAEPVRMVTPDGARLVSVEDHEALVAELTR